MRRENENNPVAHASQAARMSFLLGVLSLVSIFLALWSANLLWEAGTITFLSNLSSDLFLLLWLLWLVLPIATIVCSSYARKRDVGQTGQRFALIGLVLGYVSLALIGSVVCAEVTLFLRTLPCIRTGPCS